MSKNPETGTVYGSPEYKIASRNAVIRLLVIPVLVYIIWILEIYLFGGGSVHVFTYPAGPSLALYTLVACILVGLIVPVFLMRRAFISGAVNMFQFGFRSLRRTIPAVVLTGLALYGCVLLLTPPGPVREGFTQSFLLMLPTGIAAVMLCWVLVGTHVQALVRHGGAAISIPVGIVVTGILFGLAMFVLVPVPRSPDLISLYLGAGMLMALFFFAVRDIYATSIAVTGCVVFLFSDSIPVTGLSQVLPWISGLAMATSGILVGIHWYLSLHFVTIEIPRE